MGIVAMSMIVSALTVLAQEQYAWHDTYHLLSLEYDHGEIHYADLQHSSRGASFRQEDGDYEVQLIKEDENILYSNKFRFALTVIPEPGPGCFDDPTCNLKPITLTESSETVAVPSLENGRYIRILKDNEIKLEVDLENPPIEYLKIGCDDCTSFNYKVFRIPLAAIILIAIIVMLIHMIRRKPPQQLSNNDYYQRDK